MVQCSEVAAAAMGWGKQALSCNKTSVPQAECGQHLSTLLCHCRRAYLMCWEPWPCCSLWGCAAPSALPGMSPGSMCCAVPSRVCSWLLLFRGIYLCGHSAGAHLAAMVLCTDWTEFGVVPDIRGKRPLLPLLWKAGAQHQGAAPGHLLLSWPSCMALSCQGPGTRGSGGCSLQGTLPVCW